jgi:hypothetical protein
VVVQLVIRTVRTKQASAKLTKGCIELALALKNSDRENPAKQAESVQPSFLD